MNLLGNYLKKYRDEHNLSLRQFAKLCDISHTHIDSIEKSVDPRTGKTVKVSNETLLKIATAIGVKPDFLFNLSIGINESNNEIVTMAAHKTDPTQGIKNIGDLEELIRKIVKEEISK